MNGKPESLAMEINTMSIKIYPKSHVPKGLNLFSMG
jgi:hypothetical protein